MIRTDRRVLESEADPDGIALAQSQARALVESELALSRTLVRLHWSNAVAHEGCATIEEFGRRCRLTGKRTLSLLRAGLGMEIDERIEPAVKRGEITMHAAGLIGRVLQRIGGPDPDHDWLEIAKGVGAWELERSVRRRIAELTQASRALSTLTLHVREEVVEDFETVRTCLSRKSGRGLTREEAFENAVELVLDQVDPERQGEGKGVRRVDVEHEAVPGRYIPAWIRRLHRRLFQDRCCVPGCRNRIFLQMAHGKAYAQGGRRTPDNVMPMCSAHHVLYDAGVLRLIGRTAEGKPIFETSGGLVLHPDRALWQAPRGPPEGS